LLEIKFAKNEIFEDEYYSPNYPDGGKYQIQIRPKNTLESYNLPNKKCDIIYHEELFNENGYTEYTQLVATDASYNTKTSTFSDVKFQYVFKAGDYGSGSNIPKMPKRYDPIPSTYNKTCDYPYVIFTHFFE
jgi:hypothetical protein